MTKLVPPSALLTLITLCLAACGQGGPARTAHDEAVTLRIHAWTGYAREHEERFREYLREERGVDVRFEVSEPSGFESFVSAIEQDGVHVVSPSNDILRPLAERGLIRPIDVERIRCYNQINPVILAKRAHEVDGVVYAIPFNFGPCGIAYNKDKMDAPRSYKVLWDPKYGKRVSMSSKFYTCNIYLTALMLEIPAKDLFSLDERQLSMVEERLRELCEFQIVEYWEANLNPAHHEMFDLSMDWGIGVKMINEEYGGNWGFAIPDEGATGWIDTWAITRNITDPLTESVALAFIDFMTSPRSQAELARVTTYAPVNPYAGRYLGAEEKQRYYLTDPNYVESYTLWQPLSEETMRRYREAWERAKR